jgi:hypothetical protein
MTRKKGKRLWFGRFGGGVGEGSGAGEAGSYGRQNALKLDSSLEFCSSKFPPANFQINLKTKLQITNTLVLSLVLEI